MGCLLTIGACNSPLVSLSNSISYFTINHPNTQTKHEPIKIWNLETLEIEYSHIPVSVKLNRYFLNLKKPTSSKPKQYKLEIEMLEFGIHPSQLWAAGHSNSPQSPLRSQLPCGVCVRCRTRCRSCAVRLRRSPLRALSSACRPASLARSRPSRATASASTRYATTKARTSAPSVSVAVSALARARPLAAATRARRPARAAALAVALASKVARRLSTSVCPSAASITSTSMLTLVPMT